MKRLICLILLATALSACQRGKEKGDRVFLRSYVMTYYEPGFIDLRGYAEVKLITFSIGLGEYIGSYYDTGEKKEAYDAVCEKYGDMTYNRSVVLYTTSLFNTYQDPSFVSVDIFSDSDFDEQHPAGSSLAGIVNFFSCSAKPYIDSGYVKYDWGYEFNDARLQGMQPYYPVDKKASELTADDLTLLGIPKQGAYLGNGSFQFESFPTLSKTHIFTIVFTDENGKEISGNVEMEFE